MQVFPARSTDEVAVKRLLESARLSAADITQKSLEHFLVCRSGRRIRGVVGLDLEGGVALLRSLVVAESELQAGIGKHLIVAAEALAAQCAAREIYLLTTTAEKYFSALGYRTISRDTAPTAVLRTPYLNELCPSSAVLMMKIP